MAKVDKYGKRLVQESEVGVYIAQAGRNNYSYQTVEMGFGASKVKTTFASLHRTM
jgi:hypothetical protein